MKKHRILFSLGGAFAHQFDALKTPLKNKPSIFPPLFSNFVLERCRIGHTDHKVALMQRFVSRGSSQSNRGLEW